MADFSAPFTRNLIDSTQETLRLSQGLEHDLTLGKYINTCVQAGVDRSIIGNGDRLRLLAEGSSFKVHNSRRQIYKDNGTTTSTLAVVKMLRGCPPGTEPSNYAHKNEYHERQLEAIVREVQVLLHPPLRQHRNVIDLLEFGFNTQGGQIDDSADEKWQQMQPFLVMECAAEGNLRDFSVRNPSIDDETLRDLALDMVAGLEAIHACGIVHGDFKLDNVLVFKHPARGFWAKISDFSHSILTKSAAVYLGTERYRPPGVVPGLENTRLQHDELLSCDIWCYGISIFELLSRKELVLGEETIHPFTESIMTDENFGLYLSNCNDHEVDIWTSLIQATLEVDPLKRVTAGIAKKMLDFTARCPTPGQSTVHWPLLTVLEMQARRATFDEKYHLTQMFLQLGFHGSPEERSYMKFQASQAFSLGSGSRIDESRAFLALVFALDGNDDKLEDDRPDPTLLSIVRRLTGSDLRGKGHLSDEIATFDNVLLSESNETYYSQRIRMYRTLTIARLKATKVDIEPHLPGIDDWQGLSRFGVENGITDASYITLSENMFDMPDLDRMPLLQYMCLVGDLESVRRIFDQASYPGILALKDRFGNTALHYACMGGHVDIVLYLVERMPELVTIANDVGTVPLHWLVMFPDDGIGTITNVLLSTDTRNAFSRGLKIPFHFLWLRGPPIHWAVSCRNQKAVITLLEAGANVDEEYQGYTALAKAVELHCPEIVHILLEHGARLNSIGDFRRSAMHFVAGNAPIIKRRILHGTTTSRNPNLKKAVSDTIAKLAFYGCQMNAIDRLGNTPLHKAVASPLERGNIDDLYVIRALIQNGADRNLQNSDGDTVLHLAIMTKWSDKPNHLDLFKLLLDNSVSLTDDTPIQVTKRDRLGRDPLLLTAMSVEGAEYITLLSEVLKDDPDGLKASFLGRDNDGNDFMTLMGRPDEERIQLAQAGTKRLQRIGLGVCLYPDCS